ncbi:sensor histidine kinase [Ruania halotolerans]|uniref:sensor histidine kinase n=1 Tax=Ruania halotolerans TaxID=2897773 RepID=UPI001E4457B2|nr:HAMP domain-containing sensor histidine kinase [Ruania halotolerans]UFU05777.1 HAMP domain-containing histidine kinase [Ruania halotolerans]
MPTRVSRLRSSVRSRALAALTILSALALAAAGVSAYSLERDRSLIRLDDSLSRSAAEIRTLAEEGVDPSTGQPFNSVSAVLRTALSRVVPATNEALAGFIDGDVSHVPEIATSFRIEDDPELVTALAPVSEWDEADLFTVETSQRTYRVLALPVTTDPPSERGAMVLAFDVDAEYDQIEGTFRTYALVSVAALAWITLIGWFVVGQLLAPLKVLRNTAEEINSSDDLSRRIPVAGNDDLALLSATFNAMLARLDQAFGSQRQLLDDAGHELRTPLTIIRGHLELMDPTDSEDAASTRALALDEIDRMNLLIDDLMTLAKSRRPDFVTPTDVDVALLTDDVLAKAATLGHRRWVLDSLTDVRIQADPRRLTQALLQLASNAVKFSAEGTTVGIGSALSADGSTVSLWVRDEGVGIPATDQQRVFGRFERLDPTVEGIGLGLPIVASIAEAHGGHTTVASAPGAGSTITIHLPRTPPLDDAATTQYGVSAEASVHVDQKEQR